MSFIVFLQLFVSPLITYQYFDNQASFIMYVDQEVYMSYMLIALCSFSLGLHLPLVRFNIKEVVSKLSFSSNYQSLAIKFIVVGVILSSLNSVIPGPIRFVVYLIATLRFIGVFILLFSNNQFKWLWLFIVFGHFGLEIIRGGVFVELFVWSGFLYMFLEIKWRSSFIRKITLVSSGLILIYFIQTVKGEYRAEVWSGSNKVAKEDVFLDIAENKLQEGNTFSETSNFDRFISRLNTGWIVSKVMEHTPKREPFTNGELLKQDLVNVFLPRFLFPDKASIGGKQNQEKFTRFTGRRLVGGTTMRIGAFSDAYVNFGVIGGWICMFVLGLLFNIILSVMFKLSTKKPIYLLWIPFVFAYTIRMSDLQVILNFAFKGLVFMLIVNYLFFNKKETNIEES